MSWRKLGDTYSESTAVRGQDRALAVSRRHKRKAVPGLSRATYSTPTHPSHLHHLPGQKQLVVVHCKPAAASFRTFRRRWTATDGLTHKQPSCLCRRRTAARCYEGILRAGRPVDPRRFFFGCMPLIAGSLLCLQPGGPTHPSKRFSAAIQRCSLSYCSCRSYETTEAFAFWQNADRDL